MEGINYKGPVGEITIEAGIVVKVTPPEENTSTDKDILQEVLKKARSGDRPENIAAATIERIRIKRLLKERDFSTPVVRDLNDRVTHLNEFIAENISEEKL